MERLMEFNEYLNDNFLSWFGESKVVDEDGDPLICYHGSNTANIDIFKIGSGFGYKEFYFTDTIDHASDYGYALYEVYLKIENPLILNAEDKYFDDYYDVMDQEIRWAKNDGHDGVIINNLKDPKEGSKFTDDEDEWVQYDSNTIYVVFEPNQIKSAKKNNGNFSIDSDNINENHSTKKDLFNNKPITVYRGIHKSGKNFYKGEKKLPYTYYSLDTTKAKYYGDINEFIFNKDSNEVNIYRVFNLYKDYGMGDIESPSIISDLIKKGYDAAILKGNELMVFNDKLITSIK